MRVWCVWTGIEKVRHTKSWIVFTSRFHSLATCMKRLLVSNTVKASEQRAHWGRVIYVLSSKQQQQQQQKHIKALKRIIRIIACFFSIVRWQEQYYLKKCRRMQI